MKKVLFILIGVIMLTGCSKPIGGDYFFNKINTIDQNIAQQETDWKKAKEECFELKNLYHKNEWKLQLLGDEGEYEDLRNHIAILITAIEEEDRLNARIELATIKSFIKDIYSL
ncbi:DUF4363 family protein [Oceanobacillus sp. 143]|uniref:DUF4363 family protein n=1 Tax=Oceanobacillus zhaokaii TaxID=2052660 RepID=A0A345PFQ8_9BACI|nr:DUF4363 family protein [Oceanobacillus zhaokaii]AXI08838.1 hypothetical protein CUC15_07885 [Oceanobacillus zhaokaii]QGS68528.1 DUF4363 family protein [Oceanobacillus sp. 143]